ncbi:hypothetical protein EV148_10852 [Dokdonella fugitiva]|uniref:Uncharacterized protein n=2 Tax=Dokdonella fugitiva TaxID=328517 RepID=A0A4R2I3D1_9GAMM|nr:hypothetical protein EV148_10852 [Dokdonella fugitiva]
MTGSRFLHVPTSLLVSPLVLAIGALVLLFQFPRNLVAWNIGAWTVVAASVLLALLVPLAAWSLAKNAATRTWPRILAFSACTLYLAALAIGSIT